MHLEFGCLVVQADRNNSKKSIEPLDWIILVKIKIFSKTVGTNGCDSREMTFWKVWKFSWFENEKQCVFHHVTILLNLGIKSEPHHSWITDGKCDVKRIEACLIIDILGQNNWTKRYFISRFLTYRKMCFTVAQRIYNNNVSFIDYNTVLT